MRPGVLVMCGSIALFTACADAPPVTPRVTAPTSRANFNTVANVFAFPAPVLTPGIGTMTFANGPSVRINTPYMIPGGTQLWNATADASGSLALTFVAGMESDCGCDNGQFPPQQQGTFTVTINPSSPSPQTFTVTNSPSVTSPVIQHLIVPTSPNVITAVQVRFQASGNQPNTIPPTYRLKFDGATDVVQLSLPNQNFASNAGDTRALWVMNVDAGEQLKFSMNFGGPPPVSTAATVDVFDSNHNLVQSFTPAGATNTFIVATAAGSAGPWIVHVQLGTGPTSPYRLAKLSGSDQSLHVNWYTAGSAASMSVTLHAPPGVAAAHLSLTRDDYVTGFADNSVEQPGGGEVPTNVVLAQSGSINPVGQSHLVVAPSTAAPVPAGWRVVQGDHLVGGLTADGALNVDLQIQVAPAITVTGGTFTYDGAPHGATASAVDLLGAPISNGSFSITYAPGGIVPVNAGAYAVNADFTSADANYTNGSGSGTVTIAPASSVTTISCPATAQLTGTAATPCTATATGAGNLSVSVPVTYANNGTTGIATATATFAGDQNHTGSAATTTFLVYASPSTGAFAIGDLVNGPTVTFWDAQWSQQNPTGGSVAASFKGFADTAGMVCGATWAARAGNSSKPPATLPAYMSVIVTSSATQDGSTIGGTIKKIVIVKTDAGYAADPSHAGTGTIVASVCE